MFIFRQQSRLSNFPMSCQEARHAQWVAPPKRLIRFNVCCWWNKPTRLKPTIFRNKRINICIWIYIYTHISIAKYCLPQIYIGVNKTSQNLFKTTWLASGLKENSARLGETSAFHMTSSANPPGTFSPTHWYPRKVVRTSPQRKSTVTAKRMPFFLEQRP